MESPRIVKVDGENGAVTEGSEGDEDDEGIFEGSEIDEADVAVGCDVVEVGAGVVDKAGEGDDTPEGGKHVKSETVTPCH